MTTPAPPRILLLEPPQAASIRTMPEAPEAEWRPAASLAEALSLLATQECSLAVVDFRAVGETLTAVGDLLARAPQLPVILVTAEDCEDISVRALQLGVQDVLPRERLDGGLLRLAMRHGVERQRLLLRAQQQAEELRQAKAGIQETNRQLEEAVTQLRETQDQIVRQERLNALGQMASGVAHDFNNALCLIGGFSELLLRSPDKLADTAVATDYLKSIHQAAKDAGRTVERLRNFYRRRDRADTFAPVYLGGLVADTVALTAPKWKEEAQAKGVQITVETDLRDVPPVFGNESELRECLTNLILNASDAMPEGGTITIFTRREAENVLLGVRDTGIGMNAQTRRRCLEPFFTTKGVHGSGLGLAMLHGIVRRHDGDITVDSEPGKGATVTLMLPVREMDRDDLHDTKRIPVTARSMRILAADDEPHVLFFLTEYLRDGGHQVETVNDGESALQILAERPFDALITDRSMPGMSGDQLAARVKQEWPSVGVIMLTGFGGLPESGPDGAAPVDCFLSKPVALDDLDHALSVIAGIRAAQPAPPNSPRS